MFKDIFTRPAEYRKFYAALAGLILYLLTEHGVIPSGAITEEQLTSAIVSIIPVAVVLIPNRRPAVNVTDAVGK